MPALFGCHLRIATTPVGDCVARGRPQPTLGAVLFALFFLPNWFLLSLKLLREGPAVHARSGGVLALAAGALFALLWLATGVGLSWSLARECLRRDELRLNGDTLSASRTVAGCVRERWSVAWQDVLSVYYSPRQGEGRGARSAVLLVATAQGPIALFENLSARQSLPLVRAVASRLDARRSARHPECASG